MYPVVPTVGMPVVALLILVSIRANRRTGPCGANLRPIGMHTVRLQSCVRLLILCVLFTCLTVASRAQGGSISNGGRVSGSLARTSQIDLWTVDLTAGDAIELGFSIEDALPSSHDLYYEVYAPDNSDAGYGYVHAYGVKAMSVMADPVLNFGLWPAFPKKWPRYLRAAGNFLGFFSANQQLMADAHDDCGDYCYRKAERNRILAGIVFPVRQNKSCYVFHATTF
ncbi:hypothetical protein [Acidisarcina polymorpha]|uniref:hypothetical protein n=1 Tax=Acidisarcina polymorpha TaxID=2211140 RepID=UPI000DEEBF1B|nr:hypothetical protein [Acidisarcina polymorpha]